MFVFEAKMMGLLQCNSMVEDHEEAIEEWWFKRFRAHYLMTYCCLHKWMSDRQETDSDMKVWLCDNTLKGGQRVQFQ